MEHVPSSLQVSAVQGPSSAPIISAWFAQRSWCGGFDNAGTPTATEEG